MITNFMLFESATTGGQVSAEQVDRLVDGLSLNAYRGKKRDGFGTTNYKNTVVRSVDLCTHEVMMDGDAEVDRWTISVVTSRNKIVGELELSRVGGDTTGNSIKITIDGTVVYHMDDNIYGVDELIDKMIEYNKKQTMRSWKVR